MEIKTSLSSHDSLTNNNEVHPSIGKGNQTHNMVDNIYRTRSLGVGVSGIPDQYADGKAAKVWQHYIGGHKKRTDSYREFFCNLLNENGIKHILDVACGTG